MLEFLKYKNKHKDTPGLVIGHGPSSGTIKKGGHPLGSKGFEYKGGWENFEGIKFSSHYKEYDSHYTVCAEANGYMREKKFLTEGEIKFIGGIEVSLSLYNTKFFECQNHIYVPFFPGWFYDNTGNLAWWIAYYMGCNPIILAGLDYTLAKATPDYYLANYMDMIHKDIYEYMVKQCRQVYKVSNEGRLDIPIWKN